MAAEPKASIDDSLTHREFPPGTPLACLVNRYLHSHGSAATTLTVPPTGAHYMTHVVGGPMLMRFAGKEWQRCPAVFVGGQLQREMPVARVADTTELLGVEFRPTAFYRLFRSDCHHYTDCITDFDQACPDVAASLIPALIAETSIPGKIHLLELSLCRLAEQALAPVEADLAVDLIEQHSGCIRIEGLAEQCGCSDKKLYRQFLKMVGVSPKFFAKIVQINSVVAQLKHQSPDGLQQLALTYGYYDQAHFTRDFQRFVGTRPLEFLRHPAPFLETYLGHMSGW